MAESQFMPASPVLAYTGNTLNQQAGFQDIFARAQAMKQSREMFPLKLAQASSDLAMSQLEQAQKKNDLALWQKKVDMGAVDAEIAASASSSHLTNVTNELALGALTDMGVAASEQPAAPGQAPTPSAFKNDLQGLVKFQRDNPGDILGFDTQKKAFDAKYAYARGIHPSVGLAIDKALAPILSEQTRRAAGAQAHAALWSSANLATVASMGSSEDFNKWLAAGNANDHSMAMLFNPDYRAAVLKNTEKWQQQQFDLEKAQKASDIAYDQKVREGKVDEATGYSGSVIDAGAKRDFQTKVVETENVNDNATFLLELSKEIGNNPIKKLSPENRGKAQAAALALSGALKGPLFGGRLTNTDIELLDKVAADPTHFTSFASGIQAALTKLIEVNQKDIDRQAAGLGLKKLAKPAAGSGPKQETRAGPDGKPMTGTSQVIKGKKVFVVTDSNGNTRYFADQ